MSTLVQKDGFKAKGRLKPGGHSPPAPSFRFYVTDEFETASAGYQYPYRFVFKPSNAV